MGKLIVIAWLLTAFALIPHVTYANDAGPGREVRAVRAAAATLLHATIDSVTVSGDRASVSWQTADGHGTADFTYRYDRWWDDAGYVATLGPALSEVASIHPRAPTQGESWTAFPGGNAWAYFTIRSRDGSANVIAAGATIDIWCPFVLDPTQKYSVTIAKASVPLGPLPATVTDNTFHIVLPQFTIPDGAELMGEIDNDL